MIAKRILKIRNIGCKLHAGGGISSESPLAFVYKCRLHCRKLLAALSKSGLKQCNLLDVSRDAAKEGGEEDNGAVVADKSKVVGGDIDGAAFSSMAEGRAPT